MNNIILKANPKLIRKRIVVKTKPIIIANSQRPTKNINRQPQPQPIQQTQNRQLKEVKKTKEPHVQRISRNISPESIKKIQNIKGIGTGKDLAIIGNGPSISEIPLERIKDKLDIISINHPDERLWPTKFWAFFDTSQINRHEGLWSNYSGTIFNSTAIKKQKPGTIMFKNISGQGFSRDLDRGLYVGRSSVYACMQIALWMDYKNIYLFGVDMNPDGLNGKLHFYGTNPDVKPELRASRFGREAEFYENAANVLNKDERERFTFCSLGINPWPFIHKFNTIGHIESIDLILGV